MRIVLGVLGLIFTASSAAAFDGHNLAEAIEMAELSRNMNGDGSAAMGTPQKIDGTSKWKYLREGGDDATGKPCGWGFRKYCNRWALFQSTEPGHEHDYAIVLRGTIESPLSIAQDALALTTDASRVWFKDNKRDARGRVLQLAKDDRAGVHMGFASGLVDILFHKDGKGLLGELKKLDDGGVIYITGHSQGAALATLLHAFLLNRATPTNEPYGLAGKNFKVNSYVFAQPKPGDWNFAMDFSRSLFSQGGAAYVINNSWDWVPQSPMTLEWPSEFTTRFLDSYSGSDKAALQQAILLAGNFANFQKLVRGKFYDVLRSGAANFRTPDEMKAALPGRAARYSRDVAAAVLLHQDPPSPVTLLDVVLKDPSAPLINQLGEFDDDLDKKIFEAAPASTEAAPASEGLGLNYMPVGALVALPLDEAHAPAAPGDIVLNHHMALYLKGLRALQAPAIVAVPAPTATAQPAVAHQ